VARKEDKQPPKTKKYFRSTKSGAGMTKAGVARYRRENPGSKLKTAVTITNAKTGKAYADENEAKADVDNPATETTSNDIKRDVAIKVNKLDIFGEVMK
jgi:hypothetical protein